MEHDVRVDPVIRISAISLESIRDVDFYMPESFKQYTSEMNYRLDIFIRIVESIVLRFPDKMDDRNIDDLSGSILESMINYFHNFESNSDIKIGLENYIRYVSEFLMATIDNFKMHLSRLDGRPFRRFVGMVQESEMDVFDYGISFDITSIRYDRCQVNTPQDVIMNLYWRER